MWMTNPTYANYDLIFSLDGNKNVSIIKKASFDWVSSGFIHLPELDSLPHKIIFDYKSKKPCKSGCDPDFLSSSIWIDNIQLSGSLKFSEEGDNIAPEINIKKPVYAGEPRITASVAYQQGALYNWSIIGGKIESRSDTNSILWTANMSGTAIIKLNLTKGNRVYPFAKYVDIDDSCVYVTPETKNLNYLINKDSVKRIIMRRGVYHGPINIVNNSKTIISEYYQQSIIDGLGKPYNIGLDHCQEINIYNLTLNNSSNIIQLQDAVDCHLKGNKITGFNESGIYINHSIDVDIFRNNIQSNASRNNSGITIIDSDIIMGSRNSINVDDIDGGYLVYIKRSHGINICDLIEGSVFCDGQKIDYINSSCFIND